MRLGQLSRKINVKSSEIVDFTEKEFNDSIKNHPNCKIPDEYITRIESNFLIEPPTSENDDESSQDNKPVDEIPEEQTIEAKQEDQTREVDQDAKAKVSTEEDDSTDELLEDLIIEEGVIKAPKPEIEGVKVVGKIDLPEPKVKEEDENKDESENDISEGDSEEKKESRPPRRKKNKRPSQRKKRPKLTLEEKQKREEERYRREQEAKKKREKEQKRQAYEKLMEEKAKAGKNQHSKSKKKKKKASESANSKEDQPKTAWGKFLRWLNT